jgi:hypothetical protein
MNYSEQDRFIPVRSLICEGFIRSKITNLKDLLFRHYIAKEMCDCLKINRVQLIELLEKEFEIQNFFYERWDIKNGESLIKVFEEALCNYFKKDKVISINFRKCEIEMSMDRGIIGIPLNPTHPIIQEALKTLNDVSDDY